MDIGYKCTMSAETRFRTLVTHTSAIYASSPENRATVLKEGLLDLVNAIRPTDPSSWNTVKADSKRLLTVWTSVEDESYYANTVFEQVWDLLEELAAGAAIPVHGAASPVAMVISEKECQKENKKEDTILHIEDEEEEEEEEETSQLEEEVVEDKMDIEEEEEEEEKEEEKEEEGMEVEQIFLRGRQYWLDTNTQKIYTCVDDDVGDEVGAMVNGKPVFLS